MSLSKALTHAVQAVGHVKIDVKEIGVDMMSASAHKFNGPKGMETSGFFTCLYRWKL